MATSQKGKKPVSRRRSSSMSQSEFMAITTLITSVESNLHDGIKGAREDIQSVRAELQAINGRVRGTEGELISLNERCKSREQTCGARLNNLVPTVPTLKTVNWMTKNWKTTIVILLVTLFGVQTLVLQAVERNWIGELIKFFKP